MERLGQGTQQLNGFPASTDVVRTLYNGCGLVRLSERYWNVLFLRNSPMLAERCRSVIFARCIEIGLQLIYVIFFERCRNVIGTLIITYFTDVYKRSQNVM